MSPAVERYRAARAIKQRLELHGPDHPATWAAYARGHVAWRGWRCMPDGRAPQMPVLDDEALTVATRASLSGVYTTADLRARGASGFDNRHDRKRKRRKLRAWMAAEREQLRALVK